MNCLVELFNFLLRLNADLLLFFSSFSLSNFLQYVIVNKFSKIITFRSVTITIRHAKLEYCKMLNSLSAKLPLYYYNLNTGMFETLINEYY